MTTEGSLPTVYDLVDVPPTLPPLAVAVGVFDGVHRGHQALLTAAERASSAEPLLPAALTFHPHPAAVFSPTRVPPLLTTRDQRAELLHAHGARVVVVAPFDRAWASQAPEVFVQNVLVQSLRARVVVVGEDFRYGHDRAGDVGTLRAGGERHGFAVHVVPPLLVGGVPARSTVIRGMVAGGAVEEAARLLGRPYTLRGTIVRGRQMGRTLGYPTANVQPAPDVLVPGTGVYAGRVQVGGVWHRAAISVGVNPTVVENGARTVEAFLLDGFVRDIYDEPVAVEFVLFLRGEEKFASLEALTAQMARDVNETQRRLSLP